LSWSYNPSYYIYIGIVTSMAKRSGDYGSYGSAVRGIA
jgi:hypothetical protein